MFLASAIGASFGAWAFSESAKSRAFILASLSKLLEHEAGCGFWHADWLNKRVQANLF